MELDNELLKKLAAVLEEADGETPEGWKLVEEGDWINEGKYQYRTTVYFAPFEGNSSGAGVHVIVEDSRSGSHFTDWYYSPTIVSLAKLVEKTVVQKTYPVIQTAGSVEFGGDF